jgi:hypothetical protein
MIELNECRICFEGTNLIKDACMCKGTQAYIHPDCLKRTIFFTKSFNCSTCKTLYNLETFNPRLWKYLGAPELEFLIRITHLLLFIYNQTIAVNFSHYNNLFLICLYLYSYFPILKTLSLKDAFGWLQPYIMFNRNYYFPLFLLFYIIFVYHSPALLIFYFPYPRLYEMQKVIENLNL